MKPLLILSFLFVGCSALGSDIYTYCYYDSTSRFYSVNFFLLAENGSNILTPAEFKNGVYEIDPTQYDSLLNKCKAQAKAKQRAFREMKAATQIAKTLSDVYLGPITNHYPIMKKGKEEDEQVRDLKKVHEVYNRLPDTQVLQFDLRKDDDTNHLQKIEDSLPLVGKFNIAEFIKDETLINDFPRSNFTVKKAGKTLYSHKLEGKIKLDRSHLVEMFEAIDEAIEPQLKQKVSETDIRVRIALALATRTQAFEANFAVFINKYFSNALKWKPMVSMGNKGSMENLITVNGNLLILETELTYLVEVGVDSASAHIGVIQSRRTCQMNLETGELSVETVTITKAK